MTVTVELPEGVVVRSENAAREILEAILLRAYSEGRLSQGRLGELLGMDYWQTEAFLHDRQIALPYGAREFEADRALSRANPPG